ncbi:MAG TPA: hypothetical protein VFV67_24210 [Actinophytocola sp.]|uniref:hypothetical protein n=1 Tax=Actinophytocola sp. TaxID=1872138 RepID=UPI002DBE5F51|nr:hypothetical protein [Actinophytocola sp.]HEU5473764.1 hypothetical protein [Actinophytocola sp.]
MGDTVLAVLRDPLFAVALSLVLAILASRVGGCVVKLLLGVGAVAAFIWLLVRFEPFENVVVAIIGVLGTLLVILLICIAVVALAAIFAVHAMHRTAASGTPGRRPLAFPRPAGPVTDRSILGRLEARHSRVAELETHLVTIIEAVFDIEDDRLTRMIGNITRAFFSGLSPYRADLTRLHTEINAQLLDLAGELPPHFTGVDSLRLRTIAATRSYLLTKSEWDEWSESHGTGFAYLFLRLLCLHRDWRHIGTIISKCQHTTALLDECLASL